MKRSGDDLSVSEGRELNGLGVFVRDLKIRFINLKKI